MTGTDQVRRRLLLAGVALGTLQLSWARASSASEGRVPRRARGNARVDVRTTGARGDGVSDDTAAFQRAIDSLPEEGGTVEVPAGSYLVDPTQRIRLRSRMHLQLDPDARLLARANSAERAYILEAARVSDVEISGGQVVGDRDAHMGTTGEWGHGIALYGARRVTVRDIHVSRCWGDGIAIAGKRARKTDRVADPAEDIVLSGVISTGNRRQALTIGHSRNVRVYDSQFNDTAGTAPQCGIDMEPDAPWDVRGVLVEGCRISGNQGSGIQVFKRVHDVAIRRCVIEDNRGYGILAVAAIEGVIEDNEIRGNGLTGVLLRTGTSNYRVSANRFRGNAVRHRGRAAGRAGAPVRTHIRQGDDTSSITLAGNRFLDAGS